MSESSKDEGCWIIQRVNTLEPWLGTRVQPWKQHSYQPVSDPFAKDADYHEKYHQRCTTCGTIIDRNGRVTYRVTPVLEPEREPTTEELEDRERRMIT